MLKCSTFGAFNLLTIKSCARHGLRDEIMIKKILATMAMGCFAFSANAQAFKQVLSDDVYNPHGILPEEILSFDKSMFWMGKCGYYNPRVDDAISINHFITSLTIYNKDFAYQKDLSSSTFIIPISYIDSYRDDYRLPVTQNLFNDDEAYEYVIATSMDKRGWAEGFSIVQEDGTILYSMLLDKNERLTACDWYSENRPIEVLHFGDKYYLLLDVYHYDNEEDYYLGTSTCRIYSFERGKISTSIKKVRDIPQIKVSPTLPQKNETIKVNLGDMKSAQKLYVVDTNGKVCFTQSIQPGQENVEISTSGMPAGMYIIRVSDGNKDVDNCRVIIR